MKKFTKPSEKRLYKCYHAMKNRCSNPNNESYYRYGGRGISVCAEWLNGFDEFYSWALANGYSDNLTIDRIDNDGNYCPENCRWISIKQQMTNTSKNLFADYNGKRTALATVAQELNIPEHVLRQRYHRGERGDVIFRACYGSKKKVRCIEKDIVFDSISDAEKYVGLGHGGIRHVIKGLNKTAGGYTWELYLDE